VPLLAGRCYESTAAEHPILLYVGLGWSLFLRVVPLCIFIGWRAPQRHYGVWCLVRVLTMSVWQVQVISSGPIQVSTDLRIGVKLF